MKRRTFLALSLALALAMPAWADVKPHGLFTDNCVLQAGKEVPVGISYADEFFKLIDKRTSW